MDAPKAFSISGKNPRNVAAVSPNVVFYCIIIIIKSFNALSVLPCFIHRGIEGEPNFPDTPSAPRLGALVESMTQAAHPAAKGEAEIVDTRTNIRGLIFKSVLAVILGVALVFTAAAPAESAVKRVVITQAVESLAFVSNYVARANGYFAEEGLAAEVISTRGGGPDIKANLAGQADFSIAAGTYQINAVKAGGALIAVMSCLNRSIVNSAIRTDVAKKLGITAKTPYKEKLKKMKGLTVGATRPGALTYNQGEYWIRQAGFTPNKEVKLIGAGAGPVLVAALQRNKIQIAIQTIPVPETAIFKGIGIPFITNSAGDDPEMDQFMMEVLLVRPEYAKKNPETVRKVVRALLKANKWIAKHSAEDIRKKIQLYFAKTDKNLLRVSIEAVKTAVSLDGKITQRAVDITQNLLIAAGKLKKAFPRSTLVTDEYLPGKM